MHGPIYIYIYIYIIHKDIVWGEYETLNVIHDDI